MRSRPLRLLHPGVLVVLASLTAGDLDAGSRRRAVRHPSPPPLGPPVQTHVLRFFDRGIETAGAGATAISGAMTMESWIWLDSVGPNVDDVLTLRGPTGFWFAGIMLQSDRWLFFTPAGSVAAPEPAKTRRWTHFAGRVSPSAVELFLDGKKVATLPAGSPISVPEASVGLGEFNAALRQMRVWRAALPDEEILRFAASLPDPADPRLVAWWPMDDAGLTSVAEPMVRDLGPLELHLRNGDVRPGSVRSNVARWVRPHVLESGPFFERRTVAEREAAPGTPFPRFVDFDHDGDLDVYSVHRLDQRRSTNPPFYDGEPPHRDRAFRFEGSTFFDATAEVLTGPAIQGYLVHDYHVADFTGDGLADVFVTENGPEYAFPPAGHYAWPNSIRIGSSNGTLANETAARLPKAADIDHRSAVGDFDGDGDLDAVSASFDAHLEFGGLLLFHVNDGKGVFQTETNRVPPEFLNTARNPYKPTSVALVDADLDGDLDVFIGEIGNYGYDRILLNDGTGHFTAAPVSWLPARTRPRVSSIHTSPPVDFNRDGVDDLLILEQDSDESKPVRQALVRLFVGNGDGSFRDESQAIPQQWGIEPDLCCSALFYVEPIDQNGDDWPDFLINGASSDLFALLVNRGGGGFENAGDVIPSASGIQFFDAGDADGDGDQDFAAGLEYFENVKPYQPNAFPVADLELTMSAAAGSSLVVTVDARNPAAVPAPNVLAAIPVPHGFTWQSTSAGDHTCATRGHVVICSRPSLGPSESWRIVVTAAVQPNAEITSSHAIASLTAEVRDPRLGNNVARVALAP